MTKNNQNISDHKKRRSKEPEWIDLEESTLDELEAELEANEEAHAGPVSKKQSASHRPSPGGSAPKNHLPESPPAKRKKCGSIFRLSCFP